MTIPGRDDVPLTMEPDEPPLDAVTIAAVAVVVYSLANLIHEGLGHGGTCVLVGGTPNYLTSTFFDPVGSSLSPWKTRAVEAGGTLANLLFGGLALGLLRTRRAPRPPVTRYFWCLFAAVNLFQGGGYLLVSPFGNFGDWSAFLGGLEPRFVWQLVLTLIGALLYFGTILAVLPQFGIFVGRGDLATRRRRLALVTFLPYIVGAALECASGAFNPGGAHLVVISAAASTFGGTCGLPYLLFWQRPTPHPRAQDALGIPRNSEWIVAAVVIAALFIGILGHGIPLRPGATLSAHA